MENETNHNEIKKPKRKKFSILNRIRSANHGWRGAKILFSNGHNTWGFIFFTILAVYLGVLLDISETEWLVLVLTFCIVFVTEALNTAIEIDMDLTSPHFHPFARDTKDVAAGAALIAVFFSLIIGIIIFVPKIFGLFF